MRCGIRSLLETRAMAHRSSSSIWLVAPPNVGGSGSGLAWKKPPDDLARQPRRAKARSIEAAPAALDLAQHVLAAAHDGGEHRPRALDLFGDHLGDDDVLEEGRLEVGDLV